MNKYLCIKSVKINMLKVDMYYMNINSIICAVKYER